MFNKNQHEEKEEIVKKNDTSVQNDQLVCKRIEPDWIFCLRLVLTIHKEWKWRRQLVLWVNQMK